MKRTLIIPLVVILSSCGSTEKTSSSSSTSAAEKEVVDPKQKEPAPRDESELKEAEAKSKLEGEKFSLVVSFFSEGGGSDSKSIQMYDGFLKQYQDLIKKTIQYESVPWGREGEVDFCIQLANLSLEERTNFITGSREILIQSKLVHITENAGCIHKRQ